jgi:hypothetical protein
LTSSTSDRAIARGLGGQQRGDEVVARRRAPALEEVREIGVQLVDRRLDARAVSDQERPVELALDRVGPLVQPRGVVRRRAEHRRDRQRRVWLGDRADELAAPGVAHARPEVVEEAAHDRAVAIRGARGEGRVDEVAQPPVVVAVDVQDVAAHLLGQRTVRHAEELRELEAGERRGAAAQEELAGLAVEDEHRELVARQPAPAAQVEHGLVEAPAAQVGREVVEVGEVELGDGWHQRGGGRRSRCGGCRSGRLRASHPASPRERPRTSFGSSRGSRGRS